MLRLTTRKRYKKSIAWQLAFKDFIKSFSACCESVIITYKHDKSFSKLLYEEKPIKICEYNFEDNTSKIVDSTATKLVHGTSYITAYDFIRADLNSDIDIDETGFLFLVKHMYSDKHMFPVASRSFVNGRMSTVVIPTSFLEYDLDTRKCFYLKQLGYCDWGRAYYVAEQIFFDMIDLVLPYLCLRCDLDVKEDNSGRGYISINDIEDNALVKGVILIKKDLVFLICKYLDIDNLSSNFINSKQCYSVRIKEPYVSKSRRTKKS
jgi:hypothetical protein